MNEKKVDIKGPFALRCKGDCWQKPIQQKEMRSYYIKY